MAKIQIKSEKLTPFGGIFSIMEKSVSYTHLDVYKRQVYMVARWLRGSSSFHVRGVRMDPA